MWVGYAHVSAMPAEARRRQRNSSGARVVASCEPPDKSVEN